MAQDWLATPHPPGLAGTLFTQLIRLNASHYMAWCSLSCEGRNETSPSPYLQASSPGPGSLQCCSGGPLCLELNQSASGETIPLACSSEPLFRGPPTPSPSSIALHSDSSSHWPHKF